MGRAQKKVAETWEIDKQIRIKEYDESKTKEHNKPKIKKKKKSLKRK